MKVKLKASFELTKQCFRNDKTWIRYDKLNQNSKECTSTL